ncbi:ABC transporter substrate-binding protein [Chloroflexota bacterium]
MAKKKRIEKPELNISFIPIICAAPLLYAHSHGFFARNGLNVSLKPAPGWSGIKALLTYDKVDAAHMLTPMPLACSLGIDGQQADIRLAAIQNVNGQALTLAQKHLGITDVREMKGFTFGVPYRFSMHYYLLCYFLAANGVSPLEDVTIKEVAPPRMSYYLKQGWVDGVFAPEPFNQLSVYQDIGYIYILSKDIWPGHPCCSFATTQAFIDKHPHTYRVMLQSVLEAELALHQANAATKKMIAQEISAPQYLNQEDPIPVEQALSGDFPDGRGQHHLIPDRIDFIPHPWLEYGSWILSQMQRWGQLPGQVDYHEVVTSVFHAETHEMAEAIGFEQEQTPKLAGIHPFTGKDPFAYMQEQPFCAFREQTKPLPGYDLSEPVRQRLNEVISHLSNIAGGQASAPLEITGSDQIGFLEQILNETIQSLQFTQEAVLEQKDALEMQVRKRTRDEILLKKAHNEQVQMEKALQESEEKFRKISDSAHDAVIMIDYEGNISFWNDAAEKMFGYSTQEILGQGLHTYLIPQRYYKVYQQTFNRFRITGHGVALGNTVELAALKKDGTEFPVKMSFSAIKLEDKWSAIGMIRDITERKQTETALREAKEIAEEASRFKGEFLANMSHEIRTPMNSIMGLTGLVLDTELIPTQREYLEMVKSSANSLLTILNDVLDFSKIEAGKLGIDTIDFSLRNRLGHTMKGLALRAHEKGLELAYHIPPDVPDALMGDPGRLRQVIVNLAGNAIKFTEQGEVVVDVEVESRIKDEIHLHFAISDTGIGISPDQQQLIFEAFAQADSSTTRKFGGTGLGLAISAQLVNIMGGRIWIESQVDQGSTFHFTARFGLRREAAPEPLPEQAVLKGLPVLIVDDNATNRRILQEMLTTWKMEPTVVDSGPAALAAMKRAQISGKPFALILVDAMMPEMDGFTLAKQIKQNSALNKTTIMMLSSADRPDDAARCQTLGLATYLTKPIIQSDLLDALLTALNVLPAAISEPPPAPSHSPSTSQPLHILVAEDNVVNQRLVAGILEKQNHTLVITNNGYEVLDALGQESFDLILMDVQMPKMDGIETTVTIREKEQSTKTHIPIVAMTAHVMKHDRERCLVAGMDAYLPKPIQLEALLEVIANVDPTSVPVEMDMPGETQFKPTFEWDEVLERMEGDEELLQELVDLFLNDLPGVLDKIQEAIAHRESEKLRRTAHKFRSALGIFGAEDALDATDRLEVIGDKEDFTNVETAYVTFEKEVTRLKQTLATFKKEIRP